jgi:hypothetical protein
LRATFAAGVVFALLPAAVCALDPTVGAGAAQNCPPSGASVSFSAGAIAYLEPGPVMSYDDYGGGRYSPSGGNNIGIGIGYGELSGEVAGFCLDALYRAEYRAEASRDILDAVIGNHFGAPFDTGRTYRLSLSDSSFKATGLRLRRVADFEFTSQWTATVGVGISALKGLEGREEAISGSAVATSGSYAVGTAVWVKNDSNLNLADFNPFVPPGSPEAYGFSTDFEFMLKSKEGDSIDFTIMDAVGRLYWHGVPQAYRTLNNATVSYNADFNRNAFETGLDSRTHFVQDLPAIYRLAATVPVVSQFSAIVADDFIAGYHFPSLGTRYDLLGRFAQLDFDFRTRSLSIAGGLPFFSVAVTSDSFDPRRATVLGVTLRASYAW